MYFEKLLKEASPFATALAALVFALLFLRSWMHCRKKDRLLKLQSAELEQRAGQFQSLTAQYNSLASYDKSKTDFFTSMTHELKTPISVILGAVQLLGLKAGQQSDSGSSIAKNLKIIRGNCFRLLRLINNMLDFARADAGYMRVAPVSCTLAEVLEEIVQSVLPYAQQKQISLEYEKCRDEIITAIDLEKLERIMLNLLSNAIKFTPSGGSVTVRAGCRDKYAVLSVKDTGIGIPGDRQKEIFEKFAQVGSTVSRAQEGSGIGLWLVKAFVELHGGGISVNSECGKGSEFIVTLPLSSGENSCGKGYESSFFHDNLTQAADMEFTTIYNTTSL